ncbi:MAG: hypothetical protein JXB04_07225, partial [Kiritimatiellae bacterium]|nr:hypothetical protein [Kiritimatiellia bacterium]
EDVCDRIAILYNGRFQAVGAIRDLLEERQRYRLTVPEVEPEVLQRVLAMVREAIGAEPEVDHPRRDLEQFFIEVVENARKAVTEESGVSAGRHLADYLEAPSGAGADGRLRQFVEPPTEPTETGAPPPASAGADEADEKLSRFVQSSEPDEQDQAK